MKVDPKEKYCEKGCFACVCCVVMLVLFCCFAIMSSHIYFLDGTLPGISMLPESWGLDMSVPVVTSLADIKNANGYKWNYGTVDDESVLFEPEIVNEIKFGNAGLSWNVEFPGPDYRIVLKDRNSFVTTIKVKRSATEKAMSAFKFIYSDGNETPFVTCDSSVSRGAASIEVSEFSSIRKIGMAISGSNGIVALRLIDGRGNVVAFKNWGG